MATATKSQPLNAELEGYRQQFEQAKVLFRDLIADLDDDQFNWRPEPDRWSMAECFDHCIVVGTMLNRNIDKGIERAQAGGLHSDGPFSYGWLGSKFVDAAGASPKARKRKLKSPKIYTPSSNHSVSRIDEAFIALQDEFIERLHRANGVDLQRVKVPSPVTNLLRLSLGLWLRMLAGHQERHMLQARDVRDTMNL